MFMITQQTHYPFTTLWVDAEQLCRIPVLLALQLGHYLNKYKETTLNYNNLNNHEP